MQRSKQKAEEEKQSQRVGTSGIVSIPSVIFRDRSLKVLEILVEYLKEHQNMTYHEIAVLLNRDDRTVWTVYNRAKKKRAKETTKVPEGKDDE
jgi:hypothetical protein